MYLTLVKGAFLIPDRDKHIWTTIYGEQEVALPGALDWADIFGFRAVGEGDKFFGPIYFRKGFSNNHWHQFTQAHDLFSGKVQV